ncbi:unnamed protein product [Adineta steineri]|uniref:Uncharacterized protein n=1 Tax=Adineta steineri TaxID=433720 RepID=A0A815CZA3_9BILA|nr:unnamed protein product [Adineta steineri]CAF4054896.1 unnamed protein product [Adineta steineri]
MQSNYNFLTDHSYSIRIDHDKTPLKQREIKNKTRRKNSNRSSKPTSTNHTVSIHRSSSDKENNVSSPPTATRNKRKSSIKKKTIKSPKKTLPKSYTQGKIIKKKKAITSQLIDTNSVPPSLSIEERVKLRRTTSIKPILNKTLTFNMQKPVKRLQHISKTKNKKLIQSKKFFLGSGLDLDNIVSGNRQRRSVQI